MSKNSGGNSDNNSIPKTGSKKNDLRQPDVVTAELQKGFVWTAQHATAVIILLVAFVVLGGGYTAYQHFEKQNEAELQEQYFALEKKLNKKLEDFAAAKEAHEAAQADKGKNKKTEPKAEQAQKTGDLAKDFGGLDEQMKAFILENPKSKAARMAALNLTKLYVDYGKSEEALATVSQLNLGNSLLDVLVANQKASLLANSEKCPEAVQVWERAKTSKEAAFMKDSLGLKQALCYEQMGDAQKAMSLYSEIQKNQGDSQLAKTAKRYELKLKGKVQ